MTQYLHPITWDGRGIDGSWRILPLGGEGAVVKQSGFRMTGGTAIDCYWFGKFYFGMEGFKVARLS